MQGSLSVRRVCTGWRSGLTGTSHAMFFLSVSFHERCEKLSGGHQAGQRSGAYGIPKVAERGGSVQPWEGSKWSSACLHQPSWERGRDSLLRSAESGVKGNRGEWKHGKFWLGKGWERWQSYNKRKGRVSLSLCLIINYLKICRICHGLCEEGWSRWPQGFFSKVNYAVMLLLIFGWLKFAHWILPPQFFPEKKRLNFSAVVWRS